jgi:hypothetical protein
MLVLTRVITFEKSVLELLFFGLPSIKLKLPDDASHAQRSEVPTLTNKPDPFYYMTTIVDAFEGKY